MRALRLHERYRLRERYGLLERYGLQERYVLWGGTRAAGGAMC